MKSKIKPFFKKDENIINLIRLVGFVGSNSEARRLIEQRAVHINDRKISLEDNLIFKTGDILRVGKRKFAKIVL